MTRAQRYRKIQTAYDKTGASTDRGDGKAGSARIGKRRRQGLRIAQLNAAENEARGICGELPSANPSSRHRHRYGRSSHLLATMPLAVALSAVPNREIAADTARRLWTERYVTSRTLSTRQSSGILQTAQGEVCS